MTDPVLAPSENAAPVVQPDLLNYRQAGVRLGISASTVKRLVKAGKLSVVFPSARPRISSAEVSRYIRQISLPNIVQFDKPRARLGRISRQQAADLLR